MLEKNGIFRGKKFRKIVYPRNSAEFSAESDFLWKKCTKNRSHHRMHRSHLRSEKFGSSNFRRRNEFFSKNVVFEKFRSRNEFFSKNVVFENFRRRDEFFSKNVVFEMSPNERQPLLWKLLNVNASNRLT
jgi:hypothetical protein